MSTVRVWRERKQRLLNEVARCKGCGKMHYPPRQVCDGCRGLLPYANVEAHKQLMREHKIPEDQMLSRYRLFNSNEAIAKNAG